MLIHDDNNLIKKGKKLNWSKTSNKHCLTLLNALDIYILIIIPLYLFSLLQWVASCTMIMLFTIYRFCINPPSLSEINLDRILFNVHANIFVLILEDELHKQIGRNLKKGDGLTSFEIRAKNKEFVFHPSWHDFWTYCNILFKFILIRL